MIIRSWPTRAAECGEHRVVHLDIAKPEPARIVAFEQGEFAVERARVGVEDVPHALCGELTGLLREENIDQPQPFVSRFGPAIGEAPRLGELSLFAVERSPGALAEALLVKRGEVAERYGIAAARRRLVRQLGEGIGAAVDS